MIKGLSRDFQRGDAFFRRDGEVVVLVFGRSRFDERPFAPLRMAQKDTRDVPDWKKRSDVPPFIPTDDSYELYDGRESIFLKESNKDLVEFITHIDFDPWVFHRGRGMGEFCNIVSLFRQQIEMARPDIRFEWIPCAETPPRTVGKPWVDPHEIRRYDPNGKE